MIQQRIADITNPPPDQLSQLNTQYRVSIKETMVRALAACVSPLDVFSKMRGVFPPEVPFQEQGRDLKCESFSDEEAPKYHPELHPLEYEWYFTNDTARELSQEFASNNGLTVCLGAPKVASAAIHGSRRVVFIDRNPRVLNRFPDLNRSEEVHLMDATDAGRLRIQADAVLFDSPWYLPDTIAWLSSASQLVKNGGALVFALYPPLVRATAKLEREFILESASSIGTVQVLEDALSYETPLFEHEALNASGLGCLHKWRRADLVRVTVRKPLKTPPSGLLRRPLIDGTWSSFVIGDQVVKVRSQSTRHDAHGVLKGLLSPLEANFLLRSVSVREPERAFIDVWTSRNRVAVCPDTRLFNQVLRNLAKGKPLRETIRSQRAKMPTDFEHQMHELLALEE
jgi:hypothetical protein